MADACGPEPHVHAVGPVVLVFSGRAVFMDGEVVALVPTYSPATADRIAELLQRHGITDIPDTPASIACPWPAPDPLDRTIDFIPENKRN